MIHYRYTPVLVHHGIKGMRWGVRRFQNEDGSYTPRGLKRAQKVINSGNARKVLRNKKNLTEEDYDKAYKNASRDYELRKMANDTSAGHKVLVATGKKAVGMALKAGVIIGAYAFLTKTSAGQKVTAKGKDAAKKAMGNLAKASAKATANTAKNVASATANATKEAVKVGRVKAGSSYKTALKNGNKVVGGINKLGGAVDKFIRR